MKLIILLSSLILIESIDCDNRSIAKSLVFGLDIDKSNKELIEQLKTDPNFTNYSQTKESVPGTKNKGIFTEFKFSYHSIVKRPGRIEFQSPKHEDGKTDIVLYFIFKNKAQADSAFYICISEIEKGCFVKEVIQKDDWYNYSDDKLSIDISRDFFISDNEMTINISR